MSHGEDVEPVDAYGPGRQFDGLSLARQLVGPLAVDLDRAHRRRHLVNVPAQRRDRFGDLLPRHVRG